MNPVMKKIILALVPILAAAITRALIKRYEDGKAAASPVAA